MRTGDDLVSIDAGDLSYTGSLSADSRLLG
jgi:hypothetical protein